MKIKKFRNEIQKRYPWIREDVIKKMYRRKLTLAEALFQIRKTIADAEANDQLKNYPAGKPNTH